MAVVVITVVTLGECTPCRQVLACRSDCERRFDHPGVLWDFFGNSTRISVQCLYSTGLSPLNPAIVNLATLNMSSHGPNILQNMFDVSKWQAVLYQYEASAFYNGVQEESLPRPGHVSVACPANRMRRKAWTSTV